MSTAVERCCCDAARRRAIPLVLAILAIAAGLLGLRHLSAAPVRASSVDAEVDLRVALQGPDSAAPGSTVTYTLGLSNTGGAEAPAAQLTLTLPAPLFLLGASQAYSQPFADAIHWSLDRLAPGASRWITVAAKLPLTASLGAALPLALEASAGADEPELDDNFALQTLQVATSDLRVQIGSEAGTLEPGELVTHTVTLFNVSRQAAEGLVVQAQLSGAAWLRDTADAPENGFTRDLLPGGDLRWSRARVPGTWTAHIDLVSRVPMDAPVGSRVQHTVTLAAESLDARSSDDEAVSEPIAVVLSDLFVSISGPDRVAPDDGLEYTISYGNRGPAEVRDAVLTETLPAGMTFVSASPPATPVDARTLFWRPGRLPAGAEDIIRVQLRLSGGHAAGVTLTNRVVIGRPSADLAPADNSAEQVTEIVPGQPARLSLSLAETLLPVDDGRTRLEARVQDAFGNPITEPVTVSFFAGGGTLQPQAQVTTRGLATTTFLAGPLPGQFDLEARLGALVARGSLRLEPADLSLEGRVVGERGPVTSEQVLPGDVLSYTLTLRNDGLATARGIVLAAATDLRLELPQPFASRPVTATTIPAGLLETPPDEYQRQAWQIPDLASGESLSLSLGTRVDLNPAKAWTGFDPVFVRSAITTSTAERGQPDLLHTEKIDVRAADLFTGLSLNGLASSIRPGGQLAYDLTYGNAESAAVSGAVLTFTLPISTSFDHWMPLSGPALEPVAGSFDRDSPVLAWAIEGTVPQTGGLRVWLDIDVDAPAERLLQAELSIDSPVYDVHLINNRSLDPGAWLTGVNLRSTIEGPETTAPGESSSWRIEVHNAALRDSAENVIVVAEPSAGLELLRSEPPATVGADGRLRWVLERPLAAGGSRFFDLDLAVPVAAVPGTEVSLSVESGSSNRESHAGDNSAQAKARVVPGSPASILARSALEAMPVCGPAKTVLEARVSDAYGNAVADGTVVAWSSSLGQLDAPTSLTASGVATASLSAGRVPGRALIRVVADTAEFGLEIPLLAGPPGALSVNANPQAVANGGKASVSVQVFDACANPVADGWPIRLEAERGRWPNGDSAMLLPTTGGRVQSTLEVGTEPGALQVTASHEDLQGQAHIAVEPPPSRWDIYLPFASMHAPPR